MQITSVFSTPYKINIHECELQRCSHDLKKLKGEYSGAKFTIHPPFHTGNDQQTIFPTITFGDIKIANFQNLKKQELNRLHAKVTSKKNFKECNTFRIDFEKGISQKKIDKIELDLIYAILNQIRSKTNQYWINSSMYSTKRTYECFYLKMKSSNLFEGSLKTSPTTLQHRKFPIDVLQLNQNVWIDVIKNIALENYDLSHVKFLDAINSYHIEDMQSMILNFAISVEINKNLLYKELWKKKYPNKKLSEYNQSEIGLQGYNLPQHLSSSLKNSPIERCLKTEERSHFKQIQYVWKFRSKIAHGEKAIINHEVQNIELKTVEKEPMIESIQFVNNYIKTLTSEIKSDT